MSKNKLFRIGIDIGGTTAKGAVVDEHGSILERDFFQTKDADIETIFEKLTALILKLTSTVGKQNIAGIGIGSPGKINSKLGIIEYATNLPFKNVEMCKHIKETTGFEARITNDGNAAALGESTYGAGKNYANSITITTGTGLGAGVIIDNKIFEGPTIGTELGHIVIDVNGELCNCREGRRGCLEQYTSATALKRETIKAMVENPGSAMWKHCDGDIDKVAPSLAIECAKMGDETAIIVVNNYLRNLGIGMANIANSFGPEAFIMAGGFPTHCSHLTESLEDIISKQIYADAKIKVRLAMLGEDAGIIGAACQFNLKLKI